MKLARTAGIGIAALALTLFASAFFVRQSGHRFCGPLAGLNSFAARADGPSQPPPPCQPGNPTIECCGARIWGYCVICDLVCGGSQKPAGCTSCTGGVGGGGNQLNNTATSDEQAPVDAGQLGWNPFKRKAKKPAPAPAPKPKKVGPTDTRFDLLE